MMEGVQSTPADVTSDGLVIQVPNKRIARLLQLGVAAEKAAHRKKVRRRAQRQARRRNRSK